MLQSYEKKSNCQNKDYVFVLIISNATKWKPAGADLQSVPHLIFAIDFHSFSLVFLTLFRVVFSLFAVWAPIANRRQRVFFSNYAKKSFISMIRAITSFFG